MTHPEGTGTVLVVRLPMCPDPELSPNWRGHWRTKAAAIKQLRQVAYYWGGNAMWSQDWSTAPGPVTVRSTIGWGTGRRMMDGDNALSCLKAAFDGLTDAGAWFDDKQATFDPVTQERDPDGAGYIVVEIMD